MERSIELHSSYSNNPDLMAKYEHFTHWQVDYLLGAFHDMRATPGYRDAIDFTVTDFAGTRVGARDAEIIKAAPVFTRLLPLNALNALCAAAHLNSRSLEINLDVCDLLLPDSNPTGPISERNYAKAYRRASSFDECIELTNLTVELGRKLRILVKIPLLSVTLKSMHRPAHAAGFGALQTFLETGYSTFKKIPDIDHFLQEIHDRLSAVFERLFKSRLSDLES